MIGYNIQLRSKPMKIVLRFLSLLSLMAFLCSGIATLIAGSEAGLAIGITFLGILVLFVGAVAIQWILFFSHLDEE